MQELTCKKTKHDNRQIRCFAILCTQINATYFSLVMIEVILIQNTVYYYVGKEQLCLPVHQ